MMIIAAIIAAIRKRSRASPHRRLPLNTACSVRNQIVTAVSNPTSPLFRAEDLLSSDLPQILL